MHFAWRFGWETEHCISRLQVLFGVGAGACEQSLRAQVHTAVHLQGVYGPDTERPVSTADGGRNSSLVAGLGY